MLFHWDQLSAVLAAMLLNVLAHVVPLTWADLVTSSVASQQEADLPAGLGENCFLSRTDVDSLRFSMNVTRTVRGDEFTVHCKRGCNDLCSATRAVRLRCDVMESPQCRCKCPQKKALRTDNLSCVSSLKECKHPIFHFDVSSSDTASYSSRSSTPHPGGEAATAAVNRPDLLGNLSTKRSCQLTGLHAIDDALDADVSGNFQLFQVSINEREKLNVTLTGSPDEYQSFKGRLLQIVVMCHEHTGSFCIGVKFSGFRTHSISFNLTIPPSAAMNLDPSNHTQDSQTTTNEAISVGPTKSAEEEQLETIITGLCISVAVLMVVWLTCFLVEKKVQRKSHRTSTISTPTSSSKTYTYEVSSVRKTLMEMFDMPMIKIHSSDDSNNRPSSLSSDKSENNDQEDNIKSENEDVFGPEVSGYSTSSSDDLKECPSDKSTLLEIPEQKVITHEDFANWIPMSNAKPQHSDFNHDSPSKKEFSPKNSPKKSKFGMKKHLDHGSPSKPNKEVQPPILKSAMKSSNRKKHAAVRVAMEDKVVYTRPNRRTISNNNYLDFDANETTAHFAENNVRDSPSLHHGCTKL
ncbi:hypothetical protein BSL78_07162 [Apostichopus japonicus]|uniref:Uncharacterized protein n=1 Tax=Stichopus japonicus TaxID=307972 RepID=A0A2G8L6Q3_STIJA|nr:hypothetical protein BSL78_07162 [Apostichopus japonicus]